MRNIPVVIETPRHTAGKYVFEPNDRCFKLKKILPLGMYFPYDFGMIEETLAEDGDPADAMVLTECITYPGVHIQCRVIGALQAKEKEKGKLIRNDRFIMVAEDSLVFAHIKDIADLGKEHNRQLRDFFINYAEVEGKQLGELKFFRTRIASKNLEKLKK